MRIFFRMIRDSDHRIADLFTKVLNGMAIASLKNPHVLQALIEKINERMLGEANLIAELPWKRQEDSSYLLRVKDL